MYKDFDRFIDRAVRVFTNGPGRPGSIARRVIPKTQKLILEASLFNFQYYALWIKGKIGVIQGKE